ncbi:DIL domain containing protein [Spatholobus suberectus]|nr:DIL domain containing protein [Spatholobus suberectus]
MKGKNRRSGVAVHMEYLIHIQEIKPWPPSQSLRSLRSVLIQWENGERYSGSTGLVSPSLGPNSAAGEGKLEFNESFKLPVTLSRDMSIRSSTADVFQKNCLEFNLYETRRDKTVKGQLLGTAIIDLADCGVLRETLNIRTPLNCQRNYRNMDQPLLFIQIEPVEKSRPRSLLKDSLSKEVSKDNNGSESVSTLMNGEYAEEAEIASFTDDDVSSHSSAAAVTTSSESSVCMPPEPEENEPNGPAQNNDRNDKEHPLASETRVEKLNVMQQDAYERLERSSSYVSSVDVSSEVGSPVNGHPSMTSTPNHRSVTTQKQVASSNADFSSPTLEENSKSRSRSSDHENLDQEACEKVANCKNMVTGVQINGNESALDVYSSNATPLDSNSLVDKNPSLGLETNDKLGERREEADKYLVEGGSDQHYYSSIEDKHGNEMFHFDKQYHVEDESLAQGAKDQVLLNSNSYSLGGSDNGMKGNILKNERLKHVKSVRSSADSARSIGSLGSHHLAEVKENGVNGDIHNSGGNVRSSDRKDAKIYPREVRNAILDSKIEPLENKIKMLEGELREAAAIEAALYSVVAEHGSSMSKVHAPARRLSRLYLHACKENLQARRAGAAKSAVSGLVLVAKACGNDVPRLTFWLSNSVVLRTIISKTTEDMTPSNHAGSSTRRKNGEGNGKVTQPLIWRGFSPRKSENTAVEYGGISNWDDPNVFTSALEKVEAWIFSRIVESIWWQSLTPHMQLTDAKVTHKDSANNYKNMSSSCDQEKGNLSLDIWKNAFREACERLCPIRAGGHECGCLSVLPRLIMEQCVARLDVAMFNAILRECADDIPTDPVSDPISDPKVLPIPPGKSSFGAGAQLKTAIGNWSRWLTDLFGMDDDDSLEDRDDDDLDSNDGSQNTSFKSFHLLNALSDLLMLPKDMLLSASIRKEVCPMFSASLIKRILDNFVPDEFCPDPIPTDVFEALDSQDDLEDGNESINNFPCNAAPIVYSPPLATTITGEIGSESQLRRSKSSVVRKSYTSDDELDELNYPLSLILASGSSSPASTKHNWKLKESRDECAIRYELLRDVWTNSE